MKKGLWVSVVAIVAMLLVTGCGVAKPPSASTDAVTGEVFMLALPRIVVDVDSNGSPHAFGMNVADLGRLAGQNVDNLRLPPQVVDTLTANNIQHVEIRQVGEALVLLVNGKTMPHLGWSDESLRQAADVAAIFGVQNTDVYRKVLPLLRRFGLNVVMRFPTKTGQAEIPLADPEAVVKVTAPVDGPSVIAHFEVKYDQAGVPGIMGISAADLQRVGVNLPLRLAPEVVTRMQQSNVQNLELRSRGDGFYVFVNGIPLPNVVWDEALAKNISDLAVAVNPASPSNDVIKVVVPWLPKADVDILFHFPISAGQQAVPAKMHQ